VRAPAELPDPLRHVSFDADRARESGLSIERLRRSDLSRPFHGIRIRERPDTLAQLATAYAPRLTAGGFISHTSAAALWGLPLPATIDRRIHVSQPHRQRAVRTRGVIGHHLVISAEELTVIDGIPVTTPARTWCDLAGWIGFEDLVAAGDRLVWHRAPLATVADVSSLALRHPGRRGRPDRLAALRLLSDRADSPPETFLRLRARRAGLPIPTVNPVLRGPKGEWIGQPDLAFADYREVLEYEGDGHRTSREQWLVDLARVPRFEDFGWHVNRAGGKDLADGSRRILGVLARRLHEKGWQGRVTL
jgi:hypothetical protein